MRMGVRMRMGMGILGFVVLAVLAVLQQTSYRQRVAVDETKTREL